VILFRKVGSSGWTRTSNPPVNSVMQVFGLRVLVRARVRSHDTGCSREKLARDWPDASRDGVTVLDAGSLARRESVREPLRTARRHVWSSQDFSDRFQEPPPAQIFDPTRCLRRAPARRTLGLMNRPAASPPALTLTTPGHAGGRSRAARLETFDEDAKAARPWEDVLADLKARRRLSPAR
jgi:hypothetical protein